MTENTVTIIDGDFVKEAECRYYCSPSCHPAQIGPEWVYGCTHKAWPQNKAGDFVPIVECEGRIKKCKIPKKLLINMRRGLTTKVGNARKKISKWNEQIDEINTYLLKEKP